MASVTPSLMELEDPILRENAENTVEMSATTRVNNKDCYPSLEMYGGEDQGLL